MTSIVFTTLAGIAPIPVIYLFYHRYFRLERRFLVHLEYFTYGVLLACLVFFMNPYLDALLRARGISIPPSLRAAGIEKLAAFAVILALAYRVQSSFRVIDVLISSMLLGLGFAALENILYAVTVHTSVLLVRFISSVPLHMLTCGFMGYFIAAARMHRRYGGRALCFLAALAVPVLFHGSYDTALYRGGAAPYAVPVMLVFLITAMEYLMSRSLVMPGLDGLREKGLGIEDWRTVMMEPQFERWILRSMGTKNREIVAFFALHLSGVKWLVVAAAVLLAAGSSLFRERIMALPAGLSAVEASMLFILLPAIYGFNVLAVGIINPRYFENSIIRIPIIIDTVFSLEVDASREDDVIDTVTYHVTGANAYFKTHRLLTPGMRVNCILYCSRFSSPVFRGVVALDSHGDDERFKGTLLQFTRRPLGFWVFLARYKLYRLVRGIIFNLHLPGSRVIRELFVRPISVMQHRESYPAGRVIFRQGDRGSKFYLVQSGRVDIVKSLAGGKRVVMTTCGRGDIFGEMALMGDQPRLATAVCKTDCVLAVAEADNLEALIGSNPYFVQKLIRRLANQFHESEAVMFRSIRQLARSKKRGEVFLFSLMKVLLACSAPGGRERAGPSKGGAKADTGCVRLDLDAAARMLGCGRDKVEDLVRIMNGSADEDELMESLDSELFSRIVKAGGSFRLDVRGRNRS
jgi:CRP/FNR family transcriptional regulator, cyclic AMP receptor protein